MRHFIWLTVTVMVLSGCHKPVGKTDKAGTEAPRVFCMSREGLLEAKTRIARNDPLLQTSLAKLLERADKTFDAGLYVVAALPGPTAGSFVPCG